MFLIFFNISGIALLLNTQHDDRDVEMCDFQPANIGLHITSTSFHLNHFFLL